MSLKSLAARINGLAVSISDNLTINGTIVSCLHLQFSVECDRKLSDLVQLQSNIKNTGTSPLSFLWFAYPLIHTPPGPGN